MTIVLHIAQGLFAVMGLGLLSGFTSSKNIGVLLAGLTYGGGAYTSFAMDSWWPLLAAFVGTWLLRLVGLDPSPN